jgi:hypothetical protein
MVRWYVAYQMTKKNQNQTYTTLTMISKFFTIALCLAVCNGQLV